MKMKRFHYFQVVFEMRLKKLYDYFLAFYNVDS